MSTRSKLQTALDQAAVLQDAIGAFEQALTHNCTDGGATALVAELQAMDEQVGRLRTRVAAATPSTFYENRAQAAFLIKEALAAEDNLDTIAEIAAAAHRRERTFKLAREVGR